MTQVAERIAEGFRTGFAHPVDPQNQPPILTAAFRTAGLDPDTTKAVNDAAIMLGEAIVAAIETDQVIIPRAEYKRLQQDSAAPGSSVAVHCRCDTGRKDPLMLVAVHGPTAVVDGPTLLRGLAQRSANCPHTVEAS